MSVRTFEGIVENGQIRLADGACLPEKAKVYVIIPNAVAPMAAHVGSPRLALPEQLMDFQKEVLRYPPNAKV